MKVTQVYAHIVPAQNGAAVVDVVEIGQNGCALSRTLLSMDDWLERIHPEDRHTFWMEARRTASEGMDLFIDFRLEMPDGSIKPVRAVAQRAHDRDGNATEVIGVVMDLSIFRGITEDDVSDDHSPVPVRTSGVFRTHTR